MYRTCLFCNGDLGSNEAIEEFPVGRRLAFDAAKGRLWVVCRRCERWNLSPLEERWEAIERCEREFRATRLRVSTDNIGLARLKEGLELVRVGEALRPEIAAWRYGDQFGRRRMKYAALAAGGVALAGSFVVAGPIMGLLSVGAYPLFQAANFGYGMWRRRFVVNSTLSSGEVLKVREFEAQKTQLVASRERGWALRVDLRRWRPFDFAGNWVETVVLSGDDAMRVGPRLLTHVNGAGAGRRTVQRAVGLLEEHADPQRMLTSVARVTSREARNVVLDERSGGRIAGMPASQRLAIEMALNEDVERRALEGELALLEAAWKDAEEVAAIADDMFLPGDTSARLEELRRRT